MVHYEGLRGACGSCVAWVLPAGDGDIGGYGFAVVRPVSPLITPSRIPYHHS